MRAAQITQGPIYEAEMIGIAGKYVVALNTQQTKWLYYILEGHGEGVFVFGVVKNFYLLLIMG